MSQIFKIIKTKKLDYSWQEEGEVSVITNKSRRVYTVICGDPELLKLIGAEDVSTTNIQQ